MLNDDILTIWTGNIPKPSRFICTVHCPESTGGKTHQYPEDRHQVQYFITLLLTEDEIVIEYEQLDATSNMK